jgi:hypothetical protein
MSTNNRSGTFREIQVGETIVAEIKSTSPRLITAKVGHVDRATLNDRLYPREVWQANIDRLQPLFAKGRLTGAVDHLGKLNSGNLAESPIVWRHLEIATDGSVMGKYEIVEAHTKGKDLKAQKDAGMAIGFSTFGRGSWHAPSPFEKEKYGLPDDTAVVVMDANYLLTKIDAVDDPSVEDAWSVGECVERAEDEPESESICRARATIAEWEESRARGETTEPAEDTEHELAEATAAIEAYQAALKVKPASETPLIDKWMLERQARKAA